MSNRRSTVFFFLHRYTRIARTNGLRREASLEKLCEIFIQFNEGSCADPWLNKDEGHADRIGILFIFNFIRFIISETSYHRYEFFPSTNLNTSFFFVSFSPDSTTKPLDAVR